MIYFANISLFGFMSLDLTGDYSDVKPRLNSPSLYNSVCNSDFVYEIVDGKKVWIKDRWGFNNEKLKTKFKAQI